MVYSRGGKTIIETTTNVCLDVLIIAKETFEYRTDGVATKIESDARVLTDTTWADYDEIARVVETTSTAFTHSIYAFDELSRRTAEVRGIDPADTTRPHTYAIAGTVVTEVTSDMDTTERVDYTWDNQGRASGRRLNVGGMVTDEAYQYGYHDRMLTLAIDDPERDPGCILSGIDSTNNNYSERETWAYRYSPSGLREQKRLMTDWVHDRNTCGTAPWTHYVLSGSGRPLVVYHGRQTSENPCTTDSFGLYDRRVYIYPFEFRAYGPDGVNVIFERDRDGEWVKRFVTKNRQGSIVGVNDADGYQEQALYENYGSRHNEWNRRTGWLDRERDYETSPNSAAHKLYDLDHRKYDQSSATFLSVDPLWMSNLHQGSYVYCEGDGINLIDPWGLDPLATPIKPGSTGKGGSGYVDVDDTYIGRDENGNPLPDGQQGQGSYGGSYGGNYGGSGGSSSGGGQHSGSKNTDKPSDKTAVEQSLPPGMSKIVKARRLPNVYDDGYAVYQGPVTTVIDDGPTSFWGVAAELLIRFYVPDYIAIDLSISGIIFGGFGGSARIGVAIRGDNPGVFVQATPFGGIGMNSSMSISGVRGWYATMTPNKVQTQQYFSGLGAGFGGGWTVYGPLGIDGQILLSEDPLSHEVSFSGFEVQTSIGIGLTRAAYTIGQSFYFPVLPF